MPPPPTADDITREVDKMIETLQECNRHRPDQHDSDDKDKNCVEYVIEMRMAGTLPDNQSREEFMSKKHRCDHFPLRRLLIMRLRSDIPERFLTKLRAELTLQLHSLARESSALFATGVASQTSTTIEPAGLKREASPESTRDNVSHASTTIEPAGLKREASPEFPKDNICQGSSTIEPADPKYYQHNPAGSARHDRESQPGVLTEAAYPQHINTLEYLAHDRHFGSGLLFLFKAASAFTVENSSDSLTVWRPVLQRGEVGEVWTTPPSVLWFRHELAQPLTDPESDRRLSFRDLDTLGLFGTVASTDDDVFISAPVHFALLTDAEPFDVKNPLNSISPFLERRRSLLVDAQGDADERRHIDVEEPLDPIPPVLKRRRSDAQGHRAGRRGGHWWRKTRQRLMSNETDIDEQRDGN